MSSNYINGDQLKEILTSGFSDVKDYVDKNRGGSGGTSSGAGLKTEDFNELVLNGETDVFFDEEFDEVITEDVYNRLRNADILKFTDCDSCVYIGHKVFIDTRNDYNEVAFVFTWVSSDVNWNNETDYIRNTSSYGLEFYTIDIVKTNNEYHVYMPPTDRATLSDDDRKKFDDMPTRQHIISFDYSENEHRYCFSFSLLGPNGSLVSLFDLENIINNIQKQTLPVTYLASGMYDTYPITTCKITSISRSSITVKLKYICNAVTPSHNTVTVTMPSSAYGYSGSAKLMDFDY